MNSNMVLPEAKRVLLQDGSAPLLMPANIVPSYPNGIYSRRMSIPTMNHDDSSHSLMNNSRKAVVHNNALKRCVAVDENCTPSIATKKGRLTMKKSVRFLEQNSEEIVSAQATCKKEDTWYSRRDYASFRNDIKLDCFIHILLRRRPTDALSVVIPPSHCIRGLEEVFDYDIKTMDVVQAKDIKHQLIEAVLDQQSVQRFLGKRDPQLLSMVAQVFSQRSCDKAFERAVEDSKVWDNRV